MKKNIKVLVEDIRELGEITQLNLSDKMMYVQWAGRLSSLGCPEYQKIFIDTFPSADINPLIHRRCHNGINDIHAASGKYLAVEIFTAQDFWCFFQHAPEGYISEDSIIMLNLWRKTAEACSLGKTSSKLLREYIEAFPLLESDRFDIVAAPLTSKEMAFWVKAFQPLEEFVQYNANILQGRIKISLFKKEGSVIYFRVSGVKCENIRRIRLKSVPAFCSDVASNTWYFDFAILRKSDVEQIFTEKYKITLSLYGGEEIEVDSSTILSEGNLPKAESLQSNSKSIGATGITLSAKTELPDTYKRFAVENVPECLDVAIDNNQEKTIINVYSSRKFEDLSNNLDGWIIRDSLGARIAIISNACSSFSNRIESFYLEDKHNTVHQIIENNDNP